MKNYLKKMTCFIIALFCCVVFIGSPQEIVFTAYAKTEKELEQEIKDSKNKINEYNKQIKELEGDIEKEDEYQEVLKGKIITFENMIIDLENRISLLDEEIVITEQKLVEQEATIVEGVDDFKKRLRAMYLSGNDSYASVLVGITDFYDLLMKVELITEMAEHDDKVIDELIALKEEFEIEKLDLEATRREVEGIKAENEANKAELDSLYDKSVDVQNELAAQQESYENMTEEEKDAQEEAQKELDKLIAERLEKDSLYVGGTFLWPVKGSTRISSPFGPRGGGYHYGIDIASGLGSAIYGKPILAANSGKVIISHNDDIPGYSYGKYVAIDHGGGYSTFYGHASKLNCKVGDYVEKGDVIAYVGSTGHSTGPHLHFEIRVNNVKKNPMNWFNEK